MLLLSVLDCVSNQKYVPPFTNLKGKIIRKCKGQITDRRKILSNVSQVTSILFAIHSRQLSI